MNPYRKERMIETIKRSAKKFVYFFWLFAFMLTGCCIGYIYEYRHAATLQELLLAAPPDACVLCDLEIPYHGPCLVNLATGDVVELRVYDPILSLSGQINLEESGTIELWTEKGVTLLRDTTNKTCTAHLNESNGRIDGTHFCYQCRGLISAVSTTGYVIADVYDSANITIYPVQTKENYTIRDYSVEIRDDDGPEILVTGYLHET